MTEVAEAVELDTLDPSQAVARHPSGWWKHRDGRWISPSASASSTDNS